MDVILLFDASFRLATPLLFAALAGLLSERAGIIDIGLEGKMLFGAFAAASWSATTGSPWQGLAVAMFAGMSLALLHAFSCITHKGDQVVSGIAINMLALALSSILAHRLFSLGGMTPILDSVERLPQVNFLPLIYPSQEEAALLAYKQLLNGQNILIYIAVLLAVLIWLFFKFSPLGKRVHAAGENPVALKRSGVSVDSIRYGSILAGGAICGVAGAYLSIGHGAGFVENMTVGKGFIALAALIFGKWHPIGVLFSCLFFGFLEALAIRLQGVDIFAFGWPIPMQLIEVTPYLLTLIVLAGFVGESRAPKALGKRL
ncbi:sugar ABC transporter permease [Alteromonadales bacterium alter-6D02]|nr:sugar ABC transporter permease [Alteromonadales bacterium alter-6D02]